MHKKALVTACLVLKLAACSTTQEPNSDVVEEPYFTLHETKTVTNPYPLPNQSSIFVEWTYPDGSKKLIEGFRGWDVNHDGTFEMLEVLDQNGKVESCAFDFNGDGQTDMRRTAEATEMSPMLANKKIDEQVDKLMKLGH